jgi:probable phosphoglycerate mutase
MIYLLRHGEIGDSIDRFIGQSDIPLTARGRRQAEEWGLYFRDKGISFDSLYSSDLSRCMETARIIAPDFPVTSRKELREIDMGRWEGLSRKDLKHDYPEAWKRRGEDPEHRPPDGESFGDLHRRVAPLLDEFLSDKKSINRLIVTHAGVIRIIICHILNVQLDRLFSVGVDYSGLSIIDNGKRPFRIILMNKTL